MAEEPENKTTVKIHLPRVGWKILNIILCVALAVSIFFIFRQSNTPTTGMVVALTSQQVANKVIDYVNNNLVQSGTKASFVSAEDIGSLYKITTSYQDQQISLYATKDGKFLILQQGMVNMSIEIPKQTEEEQQTQGETTKKDKPTAELFVMSFCPYGVQAENLMKPVVDLLGTKADIKVRFIANAQGDNMDSVQSLHGATEAQEDLRQVCIMKYYDQKTYWDYLMSINNDCYGKINTKDAAALDTCWKSAATKAGIDITKIETCYKGPEGLNLLKIDDQLAGQYQVSGSPTLLINGVKYGGSRTSEAFKGAICSSFTTSPGECSQTLSSSASSTSTGGCA